MAVGERDQDGLTPLLLASRNTHWKIVSILCEAGADVNVVDKFGQTSLHKASSVGSLQVLKVPSPRKSL
jgi:ankyrin repeat protein